MNIEHQRAIFSLQFTLGFVERMIFRHGTEEQQPIFLLEVILAHHYR